MMEPSTQARPLFAPELRHNPVEPDGSAAARHRPPTQEQPLPEPAEAEKADLQPDPLPEPAPVLAEQAQQDGPGQAEVEPESAPPSRLDAMSLFQGMLAEASRSGANVPGTSMHIYALVRQLSQLVQSNQMELAA
ncbi:MAG: hypothetical protein GYB53_06695 [Rhodobacteraceae bacterium]|nr:hypothetical protein [Paracoccaceae bacterium]MBR9822399.1 hypothetical protein [Paracoccaceae bacterium]